MATWASNSFDNWMASSGPLMAATEPLTPSNILLFLFVESSPWLFMDLQDAIGSLVVSEMKVCLHSALFAFLVGSSHPIACGTGGNPT